MYPRPRVARRLADRVPGTGGRREVINHLSTLVVDEVGYIPFEAEAANRDLGRVPAASNTND